MTISKTNNVANSASPSNASESSMVTMASSNDTTTTNGNECSSLSLFIKDQ